MSKAKKVLFTAKVDSHIMQFHIPYLKYFKDNGYEVHVASEGNHEIPYVDYKYDVEFGKNPFSKNNLDTFKVIKKMIKDHDFEIIHTHTAVASVLTRLAAKKLKKQNQINARVIYTVHGYHFLKGGSLINWLLFFPVEKFLAKYTDDLIVINEEDFALAKKFHMASRITYVKGVGVNPEKFNVSEAKVQSFKDSNKILLSDYVISYIAELNGNKNHELLFNALSILKHKGQIIKLFSAGEGDLTQELKDRVIEMGLADQVVFLGYTHQIPELLASTDLYVSTSKREGLPLNVIEAMTTHLPVIVTDCRGNRDLVINGENGFVIEYDAEILADKISLIMSDPIKSKQMGEKSFLMSQQYKLDAVYKQVTNIYENPVI